jgi:hypothetical protein
MLTAKRGEVSDDRGSASLPFLEKKIGSDSQLSFTSRQGLSLSVALQ